MKSLQYKSFSTYLPRPLLKLGIGGGAIYLAVDQGLVSDQQKETIEASKKLASSVPAVQPYLDQIPARMSKEELIDYWNSGVKITMSALAALPSNTSAAMCRGMQYVKEEVQNQIQNTKK